MKSYRDFMKEEDAHQRYQDWKHDHPNAVECVNCFGTGIFAEPEDDDGKPEKCQRCNGMGMVDRITDQTEEG